MNVEHGQVRLIAGAPLENARLALVLIHGRGASAEDILGFGEALEIADAALVAPQAEGSTWYPERFLAPLDQNQPWLDAALAALSTIESDLAGWGFGPERVAWLGFSQGACLVAEWTARAALRERRRRHSIHVLTGGRIGPPDTDFSVPEAARGALGETPVFIASSDPDPHIPWSRVEETAECFRALAGRVTVRAYPGAAHSINVDELRFVRAVLKGD